MSIYSNRFSKDILKDENTSLYKIFSNIGKGQKRVLDVGCASGYLGSHIKKTFGCIVDGIEIDKSDREKAKLSLDEVYNIDLDNLSDLSKIKTKYQTIIFADILEHLKQPEVVLKTIVDNLLELNGQVLISFPNITHQSSILEIMSGQWNLEDSGIHDKTHTRYFDKRGLINLVETAGLSIKKIDNTILNLPTKKLESILYKSNISPTPEIMKILTTSSAISFQYIVVARKLAIQSFSKFEDKLLKPNSDWISEYEEIYNNNLLKSQKIQQLDSELNKIYHSKLWMILFFYKKMTGLPISIAKKIIPQVIKNKIKYSGLSSLLIKKDHEKIDTDLLLELTSQVQTDIDQQKDILNFSVIAWDYRYQRPQHLSKRFSTYGNRVFYIENTFIPTLKSGDPPIKIIKQDKNTYIVTLCASKNIFIYQDKLSQLDKEILMNSIKKLIFISKIHTPIAKLDHPFWIQLEDKLGMPIVYDCMDYHAGFKETSSDVIQWEKQAIEKSNIVIATSNNLAKRIYDEYKIKAHIIKNGTEFEHFNIAKRITLPTPTDLPIDRQIIGYYGALADWFDTEILEDLAITHTDKNIILIGQVTNKKISVLASKYKNIILLGEKKYTELPGYLQHFSICIIPFILNDLISATHPVKLFEYLSAGKPVVATKLPEVYKDTDGVFFSNKEDFSNTVTLALSSNSHEEIDIRFKTAKLNTWDNIADTYNKLLDSTFFPKISIVIVSYKSIDLLKKCLNSVINRTFYKNKEIIVIDNSSKLLTSKFLKLYKQDINIVTNKDNKSFSETNNQGMHASTGEYIVLLNNDTIITPGWLYTMKNSYQSLQAGLVGPVTNNIGNEAKINIKYLAESTYEIENETIKYTSAHWGEYLKLDNIAAFCWMISMDNYKKIGDFDEKYIRGMFEDDDYCKRITKAGLSIYCLENVFIHHFGGASFKKIVDTEYTKIFNKNKAYFEKKWNIKWTPHKYR